MSIIEVHDLYKFYKAGKTVVKALNGVSFDIEKGEFVAIIGPSGSGKSTLLNMLAGLESPTKGEIIIGERHIEGMSENELVGFRRRNVGFIFQSYNLIPTMNAIENVAMPLMFKGVPRKEREAEAVKYLRLVGLEDSMKNMGNAMSGGQQQRVAIARALAGNPQVLLLDEPTNHLDAETTFRLEAYLKEFKGTLIVVTHDRYFLSDVTDWILELDHGICYPYKGNYEEWLKQKEAMLQREAKVEKSRQKMLENELKWIQTNPSGRHAKAKARVERYEELQKQEVNTREDDLVIRIPPGPRLGNLVVRAEHVKMGFDDQVLYDDLNFDLPRGGIVGVIGANGAGKTTLFKLITGQLKPLAGTFTVGDTVKLSYVDQTRSELKPDETVYEAITGGGEFVKLAGTTMMNGRAYCSRFNFRGPEQQKKVGVLSGGERNRVHLAKLLTSGGNLLLLDEPTNDLDVATLRSLEEGLQEFGGCVMVVSHDRWFLDRIATHILAFEGKGKTTWFEGSYSEYHEMLAKRK